MATADQNIHITLIESPCRDCKKRFLGCHNVERCQKWAAYVKAKKAADAKRYEVHKEDYDIKKSHRRHGASWRGKDKDK